MKKNLEKEFGTYNQAVALRELGFDEPCLRFYTKSDCSSILSLDADNGDTNSYLTTLHKNYVSAPLKQQVFDFFREKYGLYHIIHCPIKDVSNFTITGFDIPSVFSDVELKSYKEAENACIDKLIELAKQ